MKDATRAESLWAGRRLLCPFLQSIAQALPSKLSGGTYIFFTPHIFHNTSEYIFSASSLADVGKKSDTTKLLSVRLAHIKRMRQTFLLIPIHIVSLVHNNLSEETRPVCAPLEEPMARPRAGICSNTSNILRWRPAPVTPILFHSAAFSIWQEQRDSSKRHGTKPSQTKACAKKENPNGDFFFSFFEEQSS